MSLARVNAVAHGSASRGLLQTTILNEMSQQPNAFSHQQQASNQSKTPEKSKNNKTHKNNRLIQQPINYYLTPSNISLNHNTPPRPIKNVIPRSRSRLPLLDMNSTIFEPELCVHATASQLHSSSQKKQSTLHAFFHSIPKSIPSRVPVHAPIDTPPETSSSPADSPKRSVIRSVRRALLRYTAETVKSANKIH